MQILIELSEHDKECIDYGLRSIYTDRNLVMAVQQGTVLPKCHGRLLDEKDVLKSLGDYIDGKKKLIWECIDDVDAIIPAYTGVVYNEQGKGVSCTKSINDGSQETNN